MNDVGVLETELMRALVPSKGQPVENWEDRRVLAEVGCFILSGENSTGRIGDALRIRYCSLGVNCRKFLEDLLGDHCRSFDGQMLDRAKRLGVRLRLDSGFGSLSA